MSIFDKTPYDYDPEILVPNRYSESLRMWFLRCPCGQTPGFDASTGELGNHFPPMGLGSQMMTDPFFTGTSLCRYSGRVVTLAGALARDARLTEAERYVQGRVASILRDA